MTSNSPNTYNEWKAHYLAVRKRLGGLGPSAGLVPINTVRPPEPEPVVQEPVQITARQKPQAPEIVWDVKGMPKNNFFRLLIEVAKKHNVDPNLIVNPNRKKTMVVIRRELVWRAVYEAGYSRARVGRMLRRDHTTILHDLNCWERDHGIGA
jgi:hypothetical protein